MKITIIDGNNWYRRRASTDAMGRPVSNCFYEVQMMSSYPIIVWDGYNSLEARRKIYSGYKLKTEAEKLAGQGEDIFASMNLLKDVLQLGKGLSIEVPNFEADDVIAHLARKYDNVLIESNDADFLQLGIPTTYKALDVDPKWITLYKCCVGDSSDKIKGITGLGKGTFAKLSEQDKLTLEAIICSYKNEPSDKVISRLEQIESLPKRVITWLSDKDNRKQVLDYYKIVNFLPVPSELIDKHTIVNSETPELAEPIFKDYML